MRMMSSGSNAAPPPPPPTTGSGDIIRIFLADESFKNVRVDSQTTVRRIIEVVLEGLGVDRISYGHFALRLNEFTTITSGSHSDDCHWLHPSLRIPQLRRRYIDDVPNGVQLRFELRIRFIGTDIFEMYHTEMAAFLYLYEQLTADYVRYVAWKINATKALEMAALTLRKRFPNLTTLNVEKKLDFGVIEKEGGLVKYLPEALIINTKRKHLQKSIISAVRKVTSLTEVECVFRFLKILSDITPFHVEVFRAALGQKWLDPVDVHVGYDVGVAYISENTKVPIKLTSLKTINDISIHRLDTSLSSQALVKLKISANPMPLTFTMPTVNIAESFAHLIDGYRLLVLGSGESGEENEQILRRRMFSAWRIEGEEAQLSPLLANCSVILSPNSKRKDFGASPNAKKSTRFVAPLPSSHGGGGGAKISARNVLEGIEGNLSTAKMNLTQIDVNSQQNGDCRQSRKPRPHPTAVDEDEDVYSTVCELNIDTRLIRLEELMGDGQFGNVYKGVYEYNQTARSMIPVAVKVCKVDNDYCGANAANKRLLDEARVMAQFRHPHIIKLIGVGADVTNCATNCAPVWLVMELAALGELRGYLQRERSSIDLSAQLAFACQLASALAHLHERQFLHRDVAARNCLVAHSGCLKLSDFGLSRRLGDGDEIYTASQGKVPIKWLPPESINYRTFSTMSDVYMFGVCVWEILMWGVKPWQGIRNYEVILRVERGERLRRPDACPEALYALLMADWSAAPSLRPTMKDNFAFLERLLHQIHSNVPFEKLNHPQFERFINEPRRRSVEHFNLKNGDRNGNLLAVNNENTEVKAINPLKIRRRSSSTSAVHISDEGGGANSALWRALEAQRAQCDADDRWLEEEEERLLPPAALNSRRHIPVNNNNSTHTDSMSSNDSGGSGGPNGGPVSPTIVRNGTIASDNDSYSYKYDKDYFYGCDNNNNNKHSKEGSPNISLQYTPPPDDAELDRTEDGVHGAVVELIAVISSLSKAYSTQMSNNGFLAIVKDIQQEADRLLSECNLSAQNLNEMDRSKVALMQTLVKADARNLNKSTEKIYDEMRESDSYACEFHRREVLRLAHMLAVNSKNLLDSLDFARIRSGIAQFKKIQD